MSSRFAGLYYFLSMVKFHTPLLSTLFVSFSYVTLCIGVVAAVAVIVIVATAAVSVATAAVTSVVVAAA